MLNFLSKNIKGVGVKLLFIIFTAIFVVTLNRNIVFAKKPAYIPHVWQIMNNQFELHHIKLWQAGINGNWKLANYMLENLRDDSIDDLSEFHPKLGHMASKMLTPSLTSIKTAIEKRSIKQFKIAYKHLTESCVACHVATGNSYIVIQIPKYSDFPDQKFKR